MEQKEVSQSFLFFQKGKAVKYVQECINTLNVLIFFYIPYSDALTSGAGLIQEGMPLPRLANF